MRASFGLSEYKDSTGRTLPMYYMTKDGFLFLVLGYNGRDAGKIKKATVLNLAH
jgi:Rha family phage regulatory protein